MIKAAFIKLFILMTLIGGIGLMPLSAFGANNAQLSWQNVPPTMVAGQKYSVLVEMENIGDTVWGAGSTISLGSANPYNNGT